MKNPKFFLRKNYIRTRWQEYLLAIICVIFFVLPFFSSQGISVGGDDSRLYYLYPKEYLKNYLFQVITANGLGDSFGYMAVSYSAPIISLILIIKTILPVFNVQHIFYGINVSLAFIFCFLFFRSLDKIKDHGGFIAALLSSCLYVTSPYLVKTQYQPELIVQYLVMVIPFFFYTFARGLEDKNKKLIVGSAVGVAIFSSGLLSISWFLPVFIVCVPYFIYCAFQYRIFFWKSLAIFIAVSIGLNWYWIVHGLVNVLSSRLDKTLISFIVSNQFIKDSGNAMYSSIFLNSPIHQIAGYLRTSWDDHNPMPVWNLMGSIQLFLVAYAGTQIRHAAKRMKILFGVVIIAFCIAFFMVTPNMGKWNTDVFLLLNRTIPLFSMFRNMSGKFGLATAFISAMAIYVAYSILLKTKKTALICVSFGLGIILLIYQMPLFFQSQGIGGSKTYINGLSDQYLKLVRYISSMDTTKRFVWYPMTFPGYTPIQDKTNNDTWYLGLSPLQILARKSDLAGFYGLQIPLDPEVNWKTLELFRQQKYERIISQLASFNIGYVIVLNDVLPDSVLRKLDLFSFMKMQTQEYKNMLVDQKLFDSGGVYSLYTINPKFSYDTVYLTNNLSDIRTPIQKISYRRLKTNVYEITLPENSDFQYLVLLTPYHTLWNITLPNNYEQAVEFINHRPAYEWGNVWDIKRKDSLKTPVTMRIEFFPDRLTLPSVLVSLIVLVGCCLYIWLPRKSL